MKSIFDQDTWQEIFGSIGQNKIRTIITIIGVLWGIFLYVVLSGVAKGVDNGFEKQFERISSNMLFIWAEYTSIPYEGFKINRGINLTLDDVESLKNNIPEIEYIAPRIQKANFGSIGIQLGGIGSMAPNRRNDLSNIVLKAMIGGAIASWLTASIAGILI